MGIAQSVDQYLIDGCMRCKYGATPQCKVNTWKAELLLLRQIMQESGLTEELKWGVPCYTSGGKNIVMLSAFREFTSLSFFKGALLQDPDQILRKQGENSQSARLIAFTDTEQILRQRDVLLKYIHEAEAIEKSGQKVVFERNPEPVPEELLREFEENPGFKTAFDRLTPGRQRGYIIYFSQPKQEKSRISRIEKCRQMIFDGIGLNDKYKR